jgi:16S rRNA processing protein RimM
MSGPDRLIALGAVARPHGVRGELRVVRFNPDSWLVCEYETLWLRQGDRVRKVRVESARPHGEMALLTLEGVHGRDAAEALRGAELCVAREDLPAIDEDQVYHADLIGLRVCTEDGTMVGEVKEVRVYPTIDCAVVRTPRGDREVPFVAPYIVRIDRDALVVAHLEDLEP